MVWTQERPVINPLTLGNDIPSGLANLHINTPNDTGVWNGLIGNYIPGVPQANEAIAAYYGFGGSNSGPGQSNSTGGGIAGSIPIIGPLLGNIFGGGSPAPPPGNAFGIQWLPYNGDPGVVGILGLTFLAGGLILVGTLALVAGPVTSVATEAANADPETHPIVVAARGIRKFKRKK